MKAPPVLLVALALNACHLPRYMQGLPRSEAEEAQVMTEIRAELGDETRVARVRDIFFVASDGPERSFEQCCRTVERVTDALYTTFLTARPDLPIRVYLFSSKHDYERYCRRTYGRPPSTPFGFYMPHERKMVMNIATGRGTLAHELVHPLLTADLPDVAPWFNEGFASLYEQSGNRDGRLVGLINWRHRGLVQALREGRGILLRMLMRMSSGTFYGDARGIHYATARYLCLYLQDHDRLPRFYRELKDGIESDPTGIEALEKVLERSLEEFEPDWREWVFSLK